jgi:predicted PolB exonuclease-like 3'-5' exonuclease
MESQYLVFDLETVGLPLDEFDTTQQEYLLRYAANDEEREKKISEMALSPLTGRIVCIGMRMMTLQGDEWVARDVAYQVDPTITDDTIRREEELPSGGICHYSTERTMIENFWKLLHANRGIHLVSFNGRGFDAPWMMLRSAVLGIRPSRNLMDGTRFSYAAHTDLLDKLTFYNRTASGATRSFNFDFYAKSFGIASPKAAGVDGSKVGLLFEQHAIADIAEYCLRDVRSTWDLFLRWSELLKF